MRINMSKISTKGLFVSIEVGDRRNFNGGELNTCLVPNIGGDNFFF